MASMPFAARWQPLVLLLLALPMATGNGVVPRSGGVTDRSMQQQPCGVLPALERLPPLDAVVDSSAFGAKLMAASTLVRPGEVLLALHFGADGRLLNTVLLATDFGADTADMYAAVAASLARNRALGELHGLRLRVHTRDPVSVTVEHSEYCPPEEHPVTSYREQREIINTQELQDILTSGRWRIHVRVGVGGDVLETRLVQSSGSQVIDDWVLRGAESMKFKPARLDGIPIPAWHELSSRNRTRDR